MLREDSTYVLMLRRIETGLTQSLGIKRLSRLLKARCCAAEANNSLATGDRPNRTSMI